MKRATLSLVVALALLIAGVSAATAWLTATHSGLRWLVSATAHWLPGELVIERVAGRLIGPLRIDGLHYVHAGTSLTIGQFTLDWTPSALLVGTAHINQLVGDDISVVVAGNDAPRDLTLPDIRLPLRVKIDAATVTRLAIGEAAQAWTIDRIQLSAATQFEHWHVRNLQLNSPTFDLVASGRLAPFGDYRHDVALDWKLIRAGAPPVEGGGIVRGDLKKMQVTQHARAPFPADIDATLTDVLTNLRWSATARAPDVPANTLKATWPDIHAAVDAAASGTAAQFQSRGRLHLQHPEHGLLHGDFSISGNRDVLDVQRFDITHATAPGKLTVTGNWRRDGAAGQIDAQLKWQDVVWPLAGTVLVTSPQGTLHIDGDLDAYRVAATGAIHGAGDSAASASRLSMMPSIEFTLAGTGDRNGLHVPALALHTLDGTVNANGDVVWRPALRWSASANGNGLNPAALDSRWAGALAVAVDANGSADDTGTRLHVDVKHVAGTVRERPVDVMGVLHLVDGTMQLRDIRLASGQSRVTASGSVGKHLDIAVDIRSPNLLDLHPDADGQLNATVAASGERKNPLLDVQLDGSRVRFGRHRVENLRGAAMVRASDWFARSVRLSADRIQTGGVRIDTLYAEGSGSPQEGGVMIVAAGAAGTVVARATSQTSNGVTTVAIDRADVRVVDGGTWRLDPDASLTLDATTLSAQRFCWSRTDAVGSACMALQRVQQRWSGSVQLDALPLQPFARYVPQQPTWSGAANARFNGDFDPAAGATAELAVDLGSGELTYPLLEGETGRWRYRAATLAATLDVDGLHATALMQMDNDDRIEARAALPDLDVRAYDASHQAVAAVIDIRLSRTDLIDLVVSDIQETSGALTAAVTVDGTLATPRIGGNIQLRDGRFTVPRIGLTITDVTLDAESDRGSALRYRVGAHSGDGTLRITGITRLDSNAGWPTELQVTGADFEASNTPEVRLNVTPELRARIEGREIHVDGQVTIPFARLQPQDMSGAVTVSEDVTVLGAEPVADERWKIFARVRLILGDRVTLYGFGFEGRIAGNLVLTDRPGEVTTGSGELSVVEGRYRAYGQRLEIERGLLLFAGGPVSNPGLDLRAVRQVNDVTAGIQVRGTLRTPQLELFSDPAMAETEALSYLVLGRPLESSSNEDARVVAEAALLLSLKGGDFLARRIGDRFGFDEMRIEAADTGEQAYLVVGRYLSPRLYISYGVGLIDSVNTLNIRYQLSRRWQLQAESGLHQSTDMVYTIDK